MTAFPWVFSMANSGAESAEYRSKPRVGWRVTSGEFNDGACLCCKEV